MTSTTSYGDAISKLESDLKSARGQWASDLIAAAKAKGWADCLSDPAVVEAFVERADALLRQSETFQAIQADADTRRVQKRGRGRPRRPAGPVHTGTAERAKDGKKPGAVPATQKNEATASAALS